MLGLPAPYRTPGQYCLTIGNLVLYNIITLIAAKYIKKLIKLRDFIDLDIISDFTISIIWTAITISKDIE